MPCSSMVSSLSCHAEGMSGECSGGWIPHVWILTEHGLGATVWD